MTACFLFSAAGGESPSFNYFRNFADPASAPLRRGKMGPPTKAPPQPQPPSLHSKCGEIIKLWISGDFVNISPHIFLALPRKDTPRPQRFCTRGVLRITKQPSPNTHNPPPPFPFPLWFCALVLTQRGLLGSKRPEVAPPSLPLPYPGRGPGSR